MSANHGSNNPLLSNRPPRGRMCLGVLKGANFNVDTDQAIPIPTGGPFVIRQVIVTNASTNLTTAAGGFYTAASKGGVAFVANTQVFTACTAATKVQDCTLAAAGDDDTSSASTLYLSLTTPQGAAATADVYIFGDLLA
jgi:hypothetical protein